MKIVVHTVDSFSHTFKHTEYYSLKLKIFVLYYRNLNFHSEDPYVNKIIFSMLMLVMHYVKTLITVIYIPVIKTQNMLFVCLNEEVYAVKYYSDIYVVSLCKCIK